MAKHPLWSDEYWLLLMQLYLKKPVGVKPLYSRGIVDLSLDLHIPPEFLHAQMFKLRMITPRIGRLWEKSGTRSGIAQAHEGIWQCRCFLSRGGDERIV